MRARVYGPGTRIVTFLSLCDGLGRGGQMPESLQEAYSKAEVVITKGDANYRRLLGDLHWQVCLFTLVAMQAHACPSTVAWACAWQ